MNAGRVEGAQHEPPSARSKATPNAPPPAATLPAAPAPGAWPSADLWERIRTEAAGQNKALAPIVSRLVRVSLDAQRLRLGCPPDLLSMATRFAQPVITDLVARHTPPSAPRLSVLIEPVADLAPPAPAPSGPPPPPRAPEPQAPRAPSPGGPLVAVAAPAAPPDTAPLHTPIPASPVPEFGAKDDPRQHPLVRRVEQVLGARVRTIRARPRSGPPSPPPPAPPSSPPAPPPA